MLLFYIVHIFGCLRVTHNSSGRSSQPYPSSTLSRFLSLSIFHVLLLYTVGLLLWLVRFRVQHTDMFPLGY
jgi:hypothetical protein